MGPGMTDEGKQAYEVLSPLKIDAAVKKQAFSILGDSNTPEEFSQKIGGLPLDPAVRNQLQLIRWKPTAPPLSLTPQPPRPPSATSKVGQNISDMPVPTGGDIRAAFINAIPTMGAMLASGAGAASGVGASTAPVLAGLGGAGGEAFRQVIVDKYGAENLSGPHIKVDPSPQSGGDAFFEIAKEAVMNATGEKMGQLAARGIRAAIGGPMHAAVTTQENLPVKLANEAIGLNLTPGQIAGRTKMGTMARMWQRLGEYNIFSQGQIRETREVGIDRAANAIDSMVDNLISSPATPTQTGFAVRDAITAGHKMFQEVSSQIYSQLDQVAQGTMVNMGPVKAEAQKWLAKAAGTQSYFPQTGVVSTGAKKILEDAVQVADWVPFSVAHEWRKKLISASPEIGELFAGEGKAAAKKFTGIVTETMDNSASALNPQAAKLWNSARNFYKRGADVFDTSIIQRMMDSDKGAEMVVREMRPGMVDFATKVRSAVLDYPVKFGARQDQDAAIMTWRQLQENYIRTHLLGAAEEGARAPGEAVSGMAEKGIRNLKANLEKQGRGMLDVVFNPPNLNSPYADRMLSGGPVVLDRLKSIGEAMSRVEKMPTEMRTWVNRGLELALGAGYAGMTGHGLGSALGAGAGMVVGLETLPVIITKSVYSKKASGYLMDGIGGLISAFDNPIAKKGGRAIVTLTSKPYEWKGYSAAMGNAVANFSRALIEIKKDSDKMRPRLDKFANPYDIQLTPGPPGKAEGGEFANPY